MSTDINLFETATRLKFRFASTRGPISVEDLWDVPLTSRNNFDLDSIAKTVNAELKATGEESFVDTEKTNPAQAQLIAKLELVKHVIAVKIAERDAKASAAARKEQREKLAEIIGRKQDAELEGKSIEELRAMYDNV